MMSATTQMDTIARTTKKQFNIVHSHSNRWLARIEYRYPKTYLLVTHQILQMMQIEWNTHHLWELQMQTFLLLISKLAMGHGDGHGDCLNGVVRIWIVCMGIAKIGMRIIYAKWKCWLFFLRSLWTISKWESIYRYNSRMSGKGS